MDWTEFKLTRFYCRDLVCFLCKIPWDSSSQDTSRTSATLTQPQNTTHYRNDRHNGRLRGNVNKEHCGLMYLQLHYKVQVIWALVDVLQSHNILMFYPGWEEEKVHFLGFRYCWIFVKERVRLLYNAITSLLICVVGCVNVYDHQSMSHPVAKSWQWVDLRKLLWWIKTSGTCLHATKVTKK